MDPAGVEHGPGRSQLDSNLEHQLALTVTGLNQRLSKQSRMQELPVAPWNLDSLKLELDPNQNQPGTHFWTLSQEPMVLTDQSELYLQY